MCSVQKRNNRFKDQTIDQDDFCRDKINKILRGRNSLVFFSE